MIQNINEQIMRKNIRIEELDSQLALFKADKQKRAFQIKKINNQASNSQHRESNKKPQKSIHLDKDDVKALAEEKQQMEALRKELEQKTTDISNLSLKLSQKDKKIAELERKIKEITNDFNVISNKFQFLRRFSY